MVIGKRKMRTIMADEMSQEVDSRDEMIHIDMSDQYFQC